MPHTRMKDESIEDGDDGDDDDNDGQIETGGAGTKKIETDLRDEDGERSRCDTGTEVGDDSSENFTRVFWKR